MFQISLNVLFVDATGILYLDIEFMNVQTTINKDFHKIHTWLYTHK